MGREEAGRLDKEKENDGINAEAAERAECAENKKAKDTHKRGCATRMVNGAAAC
jgi:hypothetical protein